MRDILICTVYEILLDDHIRGDEMGGECSTYGTYGKRVHNK
jgi:hypothetical protein